MKTNNCTFSTGEHGQQVYSRREKQKQVLIQLLMDHCFKCDHIPVLEQYSEQISKYHRKVLWRLLSNIQLKCFLADLFFFFMGVA